jgi:hypothetical protein
MSRFELTCRAVFGVIAVMLLMSARTFAQNAGVVLNGVVSKTVTVSVPRILPPNTIKTDVVNTGNRVDITFSSADKNGLVRFPLLVRSNCGFKITAVLNSNSAVVTQVVITSVQGTGPLVSKQTVRDLNIVRRFDARGPEEKVFPGSVGLELSDSLLVLSGPRISLGGTLDSPGNALEIVFLIHLKSDSGPVTSHLTLLATPGL